MAAAQDDQQATRTSALAQDLRALVSRLKRRLRDKAHSNDLTPSQASILLRLEKNGAATASSLARAEGMRPQSVAPLVAALEASCAVRRTRRTDDRRSCR